MTHADRIRAWLSTMTDDELAEMYVDREGCPPTKMLINNNGEICRDDCKQCWLEWLQKKVEEEA